MVPCLHGISLDLTQTALTRVYKTKEHDLQLNFKFDLVTPDCIDDGVVPWV